jgi:hypothetical protein
MAFETQKPVPPFAPAAHVNDAWLHCDCGRGYIVFTRVFATCFARVYRVAARPAALGYMAEFAALCELAPPAWTARGGVKKIENRRFWLERGSQQTASAASQSFPL